MTTVNKQIVKDNRRTKNNVFSRHIVKELVENGRLDEAYQAILMHDLEKTRRILTELDSP